MKRLVIAQRRAALVDPHDCTDAADHLTLLRAAYDTLVKRQGTGFRPHLAEGWTVTKDARSWSFRVRAGQRFHDGTPVDADAVCASLRRMARPEKGYTLGAPGVWHQYLAGAEITAPDPGRVELRLAAPVADLLDILDQAFIAAPAALARLDAGETAPPIGSGPYRIEGAGQDLIGTRVADHFAPGVYDEIRWVAVPDAAARLDMLARGAIDLACDLDATAVSLPGRGYLRHLAPVAIIYLLNAARGPCADMRVRRALSLAVDRPALIETVLGGQAAPLMGFVSPGHFGAERVPVPTDRDKARALLAEAGHGDGLTLAVDCPTRLPDEAEALTVALGDQLAQVGVTFQVHRYEDREAYAHMVRRKEIHDLCVFDSSPMSTFRVLYEKIDSRIAGAWWQGYRNAEVERLLDTGRCEIDDGARATHYRAAYRALQHDPPWLTLYNPYRFLGLARSGVKVEMPVDGVLDVAALPPGLEQS